MDQFDQVILNWILFNSYTKNVNFYHYNDCFISIEFDHSISFTGFNMNIEI